MKVIVTGGAGFIGSHLVDHLINEGHDVKVLDNLSTGQLKNLKKSESKIEFINVDLSKNENLQDIFKNTDWVFHLAGLADIVPSIMEPKKYFNSNVLGTLNVLEASRKNNIKSFVYAASASCYGIPNKYPTDENSKIDTQYPYALTKYLGENLVMHYAKVYKMPNTSLRFFNVYGPRSRTTGAYGAVFGVFLAQKLNKNPLTIVGDGNQTRDFIHVNDLVEAILKVANKNIKNEIFNLGSSKEITVNKIADLIGGEKIFIPERPGEPNRSCADISKIKKAINWEPKINIEDGVKTLLDKINDWKEAPVWTPEKIKVATQEWFSLLEKKNEK
tara:strand:- start:1292 stop:2284 length:993 start_codon:yes stop_codon:yes gene_type:complete